MVDVLDHGSVLLIDHMASDQKVTGAARVSTGKGPEYTSKGREADEKLIRYLMEHRHGTPFEHAVFQFFVKAPIFVVREWQRHRIASYNEQSGRYAEFQPEFYVPGHVRVPDPNNKQGAVRYEDHPDDPTGGGWDFALIEDMRTTMEAAFDEYRRLLDAGVAREMARIVLPLSLYTSFWFTVNARSLLNFLSLRNAPGAQWEIRDYARAIEAMFAEIMPLTYVAFVDAGRVAP
jgi:thymidylate synthase (FAD)